MRTVTTSIRLSVDLRDQLESAAQMTHHAKSWIITQALREYLSHYYTETLVKEARRQSLLASQQDHKTDEIWQDNIDDTGWV